MDKDLKRIITETVNQFFDKEPEKMIEQGIRNEYYDVCPHCKQEIHEKHEYTEDGGLTWRHSDCKGLINRPETPLEEISTWIRPYVEEARKIRKETRIKRGIEKESLPISGEEKYNKQEPGGQISAINIA